MQTRRSGAVQGVPHNLRHLFATAFYRACKDIARLADLLGHSSIETTRIYLVTSGLEHARQLERLGARFVGQTYHSALTIRQSANIRLHKLKKLYHHSAKHSRHFLILGVMKRTEKSVFPVLNCCAHALVMSLSRCVVTVRRYRARMAVHGMISLYFAGDARLFVLFRRNVDSADWSGGICGKRSDKREL